MRDGTRITDRNIAIENLTSALKLVEHVWCAESESEEREARLNETIGRLKFEIGSLRFEKREDDIAELKGIVESAVDAMKKARRFPLIEDDSELKRYLSDCYECTNDTADYIATKYWDE
tara:strand:- start:47 stop:403 length:357 start_codon:yes stop_codon:yes gene_type:complete